MSELEAIHFMTHFDGGYEAFYPKDEADKVIAELKAQKAQAEDDCAYWKMCHGNAANAMHETEEYAMQLYNELRHSNHKRCLAMAGKCENGKLIYQYKQRCGDAETEIGLDYLMKRAGWYRKWQLRWLELAEKFNEAN